MLLFASWIMARWEHRKIADYGLPSNRILRSEFWKGAIIGFGSLSVLLIAMRFVGVFHFGSISLSGVETLLWGLGFAIAFIIVGLEEEFMFRGYPLFTLTTGMTFWPAAILLSALFGFGHYGNAGETILGLSNASFGGLLFAFVLRRTGNLWLPIGLHAGWDYAQTFFYGVPDSGFVLPGHLFNPTFTGSKWLTGGSVGPEGSILCTLIFIVMWIAFALWFPTNRYPNPDAISPRKTDEQETFSPVSR